jgi:hypothetical protein
VPEVQPFLLAVPVFGQVEGEVAVAGGAGGDGDGVAADGGGAGLRVQGCSGLAARIQRRARPAGLINEYRQAA